MDVDVMFTLDVLLVLQESILVPFSKNMRTYNTKLSVYSAVWYVLWIFQLDVCEILRYKKIAAKH